MNRPIERFEDLVAWQKARQLTREIYRLTKNGAFARDFGLTGQLQRASVSIMSNIAEGFDRGGRGEFHQFLVIAKGSCAEVRSLLYVSLDAGYLSEVEFNALMISVVELTRVLSGLRTAVENQWKSQRKNPKPGD